MVDGTIYISTPDNAWAIDARDGHEIWHYYWKTRGGTHIANRGLGMWNNYLFMETPDDYLVSLDAKTGKERWHKVIADFSLQYFSTTAPVIVGNHVLVGTGNDLDAPGFLQSFDPETGELQWKFNTVPMNEGDAGLDTWPSLDAARHGGAQPWMPGAYDPETHLYIFGTGNPTPAYTAGRGEGDNLFTCSLMAVHVDTGKMAWYFQTSPHDMHDWDSAQTPILFDARINGKMRKLVSTAARNGVFFTLDRTTGESIVTSTYGSSTNWVKGLNKAGGPVRKTEKDPAVGGSIVSPPAGGTINWQPPAYSPDTGLFYVSEHNGYSIFYLTDLDPRGSMGLGGKEEVNVGSGGSFLTAIDPKTGKAAWRHRYPSVGGGGGGGGLLATAGGLVFGGDGSGNIVAFDAANGKPLWHSGIDGVSAPPQTYMLDGHQYLLVASNDTLYAFTLYLIAHAPRVDAAHPGAPAGAACRGPAAGTAPGRGGHRARPICVGAGLELLVEGSSGPSGRRRVCHAGRDDVPAMVDRRGSRAPALDALDHGRPAAEREERCRVAVHHGREPGQGSASGSAAMDGRARARHGNRRRRTSSRSEPASGLQRRSVAQAAQGGRFHRVHVESFSAHRRRAMAGAAADDEERRPRDGCDHGVHRIAARRRSGGRAFRRVWRVEARMDDVDHGGRRSPGRRHRAGGDRHAQHRAVVHPSLAGVRRVVGCRQGLRRPGSHGANRHARVPRAHAHRGALRVPRALDASEAAAERRRRSVLSSRFVAVLFRRSPWREVLALRPKCGSLARQERRDGDTRGVLRIDRRLGRRGRTSSGRSSGTGPSRSSRRSVRRK